MKVDIIFNFLSIDLGCHDVNWDVNDCSRKLSHLLFNTTNMRNQPLKERVVYVIWWKGAAYEKEGQSQHFPWHLTFVGVLLDLQQEEPNQFYPQQDFSNPNSDISDIRLESSCLRKKFPISNTLRKIITSDNAFISLYILERIRLWRIELLYRFRQRMRSKLRHYLWNLPK